MLASVLIQLYDLPPLKHIQDDSVIGHTKSPPIYKQIPQIVHTHGCPHALTMKVPGLHFPKYLVLARELRSSLISHYERFKGDYGNPDFGVFLRGDIQKKKYHSDIWTRIRFMNEWGRMLEQHPDRVKLIRYEDLEMDAPRSLRTICEFFGIRDVTDEMIDRAIGESSPEEMATKPNPSVTTKVVRTGERKPMEAYFNQSNQRFFEQIVGRHLLYDYGYGYKLRKANILEMRSNTSQARVFVTRANDEKSGSNGYKTYPPPPLNMQCAKCHCHAVVRFDSSGGGLVNECKKDGCPIVSQLPSEYRTLTDGDFDGVRISFFDSKAS